MSKKETSNHFYVRRLSFCGVALALGTVTSLIKVFHFPFGGSITLLSMLFICLIGYFYGPVLGISVGVAYGLLQFFVEPILVHPMQLILDYFLAFGALGLSGFFYKKKHGLLIGYLVGITGRWICAALSGYIFWSEYAWDGWNAFAYTLVYNGIYIYAEGIITIILIALPPVANAINRVRASVAE
ncbi:MAG TPA: energy-coupled thiamine transporter ThiT [Lachnospiraceae bacterium]|jgi:thiamine transporter|nr:energy-coupled thiamine transporter ThiT [Lachnospiraceae bacterium]